MAPAVKVRHVRDVRDKLVKQLLEQQAKKALKVAEDTGKQARKDLNKTLQHRGETDENGFGGANVRWSVERVQKTKQGVIVTLRVWMADGSGDPHYVWHLLQFGRRKFTQPRTSPSIPERVNTPRTQPGTLAAESFGGYTGEFFRVRKGTEVPELPARGWYEIVRDHRESEVPQRWEGWAVTEAELIKMPGQK